MDKTEEAIKDGCEDCPVEMCMWGGFVGDCPHNTNEPEPTDEDCVMWSMVGTKVYKKCAQVYKLEKENAKLKLKPKYQADSKCKTKGCNNIIDHDYCPRCRKDWES